MGRPKFRQYQYYFDTSSITATCVSVVRLRYVTPTVTDRSFDRNHWVRFPRDLLLLPAKYKCWVINQPGQPLSYWLESISLKLEGKHYTPNNKKGMHQKMNAKLSSCGNLYVHEYYWLPYYLSLFHPYSLFRQGDPLFCIFASAVAAIPKHSDLYNIIPFHVHIVFCVSIFYLIMLK